MPRAKTIGIPITDQDAEQILKNGKLDDHQVSLMVAKIKKHFDPVIEDLEQKLNQKLWEAGVKRWYADSYMSGNLYPLNEWQRHPGKGGSDGKSDSGTHPSPEGHGNPRGDGQADQLQA